MAYEYSTYPPRRASMTVKPNTDAMMIPERPTKFPYRDVFDDDNCTVAVCENPVVLRLMLLLL